MTFYTNKKILHLSTVILTASFVFFFSCKPSEPPLPYQYESEPEFAWGYAEFYGDYYNHGSYRIPNNVITLNLFTDNFFVRNDSLLGLGQYLIIEDVFIMPGDTLLPAGTYNLDENGEPFTFFGGKIFEDNRQKIPSGAYIYFIESDPSDSKTALVTGGSMTISIENDSIYNIACDFTLDEKTELKGTFRNVLYHFDRTAEAPAGMPRKKIFPMKNGY
ncbi:MAG: hypothetical protein ACK5KP_02270 [Paludibacteraceae bacterium]